MAAENSEQAANAGEHALTPKSYIEHHLKFLQEPVGDGGGSFWTLNVDTLVTSTILGVLVLGFITWVARGATAGVPSGRQALVEFVLDFVNGQVKSIFDKSYTFVAPLALTVFLWVLFMNAMDFLPVDIVAGALHAIGIDEFRLVPTADVNTTFALALSVWFLMIGFAIKAKGLGGFLHEFYAAPFGTVKLTWNPLSWVFFVLLALANFAFQLIEYVSKPLSHSLRLFGNMYAGEIIFLLLWLLAATSIAGAIAGIVFGAMWAVFHILIVLLQAYIFMMLTVVYISLAHEHH